MENETLENFIIANSPDGGFLQSEYWRKFQESYGRKTHEVSVSDDGGELVAYANIITHTLPIVGDYFYIPRGPVMQVQSSKFKVQSFFEDLIKLAKENRVGWIRVEPNDENSLEIIRNLVEISGNKLKIVKAPVDVQSKEILVLDITKSEEEILGRMKQKTRYNIRLAGKRGVKIKSIKYQVENTKYFDEFLRLIKITAKRDKIMPHLDDYYRKMFEIIPGDILKLYIAEYEGKIISANTVSFFGKTATYMHGASDYAYREVMAPYLLQWQAILDARKSGLTQYDFGGVDTRYEIRDTKYKKWAGITKFKTGFAPDVEPMKFPGCWDIVLNSAKYNLYRVLQKIKRLF